MSMHFSVTCWKENKWPAFLFGIKSKCISRVAYCHFLYIKNSALSLGIEQTHLPIFFCIYFYLYLKIREYSFFQLLDTCTMSTHAKQITQSIVSTIFFNISSVAQSLLLAFYFSVLTSFMTSFFNVFFLQHLAFISIFSFSFSSVFLFSSFMIMSFESVWTFLSVNLFVVVELVN